MNFIEEMKARAERTKAVWEQIDGLMMVLNSRELSENEAVLLKIITLLSEQLRPLGAEQDLGALTDDVGKMFMDLMTETTKAKK